MSPHVSPDMRAATSAIGARIRQARVRRGMSQEKLGVALDVTFQQIQKYENGRNRVSACALLKIADALDTDITFFMPAGKAPPSRAEIDDIRHQLRAARDAIEASIAAQQEVLVGIRAAAMRLDAADDDDDDDGCPKGDPDCLSRSGDCHDACSTFAEREREAA